MNASTAALPPLNGPTCTDAQTSAWGAPRTVTTPTTTHRDAENVIALTTERKVIAMPETLRIGSLFSGY